MQTIDKRYQMHLKELDLYNGPIDGLQGRNTTTAVRGFQRLNGLTADGVVGGRTREAFESALTARPADTNESSAPSSDIHYSYRRWPRETTENLMNFYGGVGKNQMLLEVPYEMKLAWNTRQKIKVFSCHEKVGEAMYTALERVKKAYSPSEISQHGFDLFGGCLNVRQIRGGTRWSTHAWGIAIDFDPARNGLRTPWSQAYLSRPECAEFMDAWKSVGAYSLGREKNMDAMHQQFCYR